MAEMTFGEWLQRERQRLRLTQAQLAGQIGCSTIALRKIEAEERRPSSSIIDRLADIFAIAPSDRAAFQRFARGDWQAAPASLLTSVVWHVERATPGSRLPAPLTSFIGRERDIAKVHEYLAGPTTRHVTLMGPPGIGKTRLSLQVANELLLDFADGVFFVPLAPISDPVLVAPAIAQALGLVQADQRSPHERLMEGIADRQILIVLDNFEQVIEAAPLVPELLAACPRLKLIVTSRESLRTPGKWLYAVPPLLTPDDAQLKTLPADGLEQFSALRLFADRARAVRSDFVLARENLPAVAEICRRLDGLPLAIELIAARARLMSPPLLLSNLTRDLTLHADGMRGMPARQKTLHAAIAWSYDLLSRDEQTLLARLAVFFGGFTLEAAQAVAQTPDAIPGLASLIDKSLVVKTFEANGEARFNLLFMIREFTLDRLRDMNGEVELRDRHAAYFLDLAEQADREIHGPQQAVWIDRLEIEASNYRSALDWTVAQRQTDRAMRLLAALQWAWGIRGYYSDVRLWFEKVRALPDITQQSAVYARLLNGLSRQGWLMEDHDQARAWLNESRALALTLGAEGEAPLAEALDFLGLLTMSTDSGYAAAQAYCEQAVALYRACGDQWGLAESLYHVAWLARLQHADRLAAATFEQSLDLFQQLGDVWGLSRATAKYAELYLIQGQYATAWSMFEQCLTWDTALRHKQGIAVALLMLGEVCRHQGDDAAAIDYYEQSRRLDRECGLPTADATCTWVTRPSINRIISEPPLNSGAA